MARIYGEGGFQVHIWPNDHPPAHVHVIRAEGLVVVDLLTMSVREAHDMKHKDIRRACQIVEENRSTFLLEWRRIHG